MTVDEYLEIERQRGNIITGGGYDIQFLSVITVSLSAQNRPQSESRPTTSEQLQLDSEMDGTVFGEEKAEEKGKGWVGIQGRVLGPGIQSP